MGIVATATVVPRSEYRKRQRDRQHYVFPRSLKKYSLDKAWHAIDVALQAVGPPAHEAVRGNRPDFESFDEFDEVYSAFATPGFIKKVSTALGRIDDGQFLDCLKQQGWKDSIRTKSEREYYLHYLCELRKAYREAARKDSYLWILLS